MRDRRGTLGFNDVRALSGRGFGDEVVFLESVGFLDGAGVSSSIATATNGEDDDCGPLLL